MAAATKRSRDGPRAGREYRRGREGAYLQEHPKGFKYTAFCNRYRKWKERRGMRQVHKAGKKMLVNYSGKKLSIVDREAGELARSSSSWPSSVRRA